MGYELQGLLSFYPGRYVLVSRTGASTEETTSVLKTLEVINV